MSDPTRINCPYAITPAGLRDLNQIRHLEKVCFPEDAWPILDVISVLTLPNVIRLKATCGDKIIGFVAGDIRRLERTSWIATIGVLPEYRRQGIGRALLEACEGELPTRSIRLSVRPTNQEAINLYKSMGYVQVGSWEKYYQDGSDAIVMEKERESGL